MIRIILFLLFSLLFLGNSITFTPSINLTPSYVYAMSDSENIVYQKAQNGAELFHRGDYEKAILAYNDALRINKNTNMIHSLYNDIGMCYFKLKKLDMAESYLTKAIEDTPTFANAYNNRGLVRGTMGKTQQAINDCTKAIELKPNYANAYFNRGQGYMNQKKYNDAISDFSKTIYYNPNDAEAYSKRGISYASIGKYSDALSDLNKAIELNPRDWRAYFFRGMSYINRDQYSSAIHDYSTIIQYSKDKKLVAGAYLSRGLCFRNIGSNEQAQADFQKAKEMGYELPS